MAFLYFSANFLSHRPLARGNSSCLLNRSFFNHQFPRRDHLLPFITPKNQRNTFPSQEKSMWRCIQTGAFGNKTNLKEEEVRFIRSKGGVHEYRLMNNMQILLYENNTAPVTTIMTTYHVGSRNEVEGVSKGMSHILEHMLFKGSINYNGDLGNSIWDILEGVGAHVNANTGYDRTTYYATVPSGFVYDALKVEADRMRGALLREKDLEKELEVIRNEYEIDNNDNGCVFEREVWLNAFEKHPYRYPVIGMKKDIDAANINSIRAFYDIFYHPNNASLIIVGDLGDEDLLLSRIIKLFGHIPKINFDFSGPLQISEPVQLHQKRVTVQRNGSTPQIIIGHKSPPTVHPDSFPLLVLAMVLSQGESSRLERALRETGLVTYVSSSANFQKDNSLFVTSCYISPGVSSQEVEKKIFEIYQDIKTCGIEQKELDLVRSKAKFFNAFSKDSSYAIAESINEYLSHGDYDLFFKERDMVDNVTCEDVKRVAQTYLRDDNCIVGILEIQDSSENDDIEPSDEDSFEVDHEEGSKNCHITIPHSEKKILPKFEFLSLEATKIGNKVTETKMLSGMVTVTCLPMTVKGICTIKCSFPGGERHSRLGIERHTKHPQAKADMLADLMESMMLEGSVTRSKYEIDDSLSLVGASLYFSVNRCRTSFTLYALTEGLEEAMSIVVDQLMNPKFDEKSLESVKSKFLGEAQIQKESADRTAMDAFLSEIYLPGHANYSFSIDEYMEALQEVTTNDLRTFHNMLGIGPKMYVVAAGDLKLNQLTTALTPMLNSWKSHSLPELPEEDNTLITKQIGTGIIKKFIYMDGKENLEIRIGQPIKVDINNPDYFPLLIVIHILGGSSSSKLMRKVREIDGLTYDIDANLEGCEHAYGLWYISASFGASRIKSGLRSIFGVLQALKTDGISEEELNSAKISLCGTYQVGLSSTKSLCSVIMSNYERSRPLTWIDEFKERLGKLTVSRLREVIDKHIDLDNLVIAGAGTPIGGAQNENPLDY